MSFTALGQCVRVQDCWVKVGGGLQNHAPGGDIDQLQAASEIGHVVQVAFFVRDFDKIAVASSHFFAGLLDVSRAGRVYGACFAVVMVFDYEFHAGMVSFSKCGLSVHRFRSVLISCSCLFVSVRSVTDYRVRSHQAAAITAPQVVKQARSRGRRLERFGAWRFNTC